MPIRLASVLADELIGLLRPDCERIEVAGSVRRGRAVEVKDLELVAISKITERLPRHDLFGAPVPSRPPIDHLHERIVALIAKGILHRRQGGRSQGNSAFGRRYKALVYGHLAVDLFAVLPPAQWGVILLIRTGPATYSRLFVTSRALGGWLPAIMQVKDGALSYRTGTLIPTPEEADVFRAVGYVYVSPADRERLQRPVKLVSSLGDDGGNV